MLTGFFDSQLAPLSLDEERCLLDSHRGDRDDDSVLIRQPGLRMVVNPGCYARSRSDKALAWDGRLDNGGELWPGCDCSRGDDAAIALSVLERGGEAALRELIGDWSAVFWDAERSTVVLASDYTGVRPLYYRYADGRLTWSSSLDCLASRLGEKADIDDDYIAEFLERGGSFGRTPYREIRVVPPGHSLRVSRRGVVLTAFWKLNPEPLRFRDERDYAARFRELFEEAVAVRMRTVGPVYAEMSGGLDSSAVVCMAHRLIEQGRVPASRLSTVHYRHQGSPDERFNRIMESSLALDSVHLDTSAYPFIAEERPGGSAPAWRETRNAEIARKLKADGSSVLLTGRLGDLVMGNHFDDSEQVADLLGQFSVSKACTEAFAWSRLLHVPVYSILGRAARLNLPFSPAAKDWNHAPPSTRKHCRMLSEVLRSRVLQTPEPLRQVFYTHPYSHRPLVEFMLAIPSPVVCGPGRPRRLMRDALGDLLPSTVLGRRSKASFNTVFNESLFPIAAAFLETPGKMRVVERGWVDVRGFESRLRRFLEGLECNAPQLRQVILLELWLRNLETRRMGNHSAAMAAASGR
jgi:asparagine synthase (glutamine-hydrolysing)